MILNIILTSYNRPCFVKRAIESVLAQTDRRWRLYVLDDASNEATQGLLWQYVPDKADNPPIQIEFGWPEMSAADRAKHTRYSVLINSVMPGLSAGVVAYMCDNVEYDPRLVATVLDYFERHPQVYAGYVPHGRDIYTADGEYLGPAAIRGHWNVTPPQDGALSGRVMGLLDHSQVFHRLPCDLRWNESPEVRSYGDGEFFNRLTALYGPIHQISADILTNEHLFA